MESLFYEHESKDRVLGENSLVFNTVLLSSPSKFQSTQYRWVSQYTSSISTLPFILNNFWELDRMYCLLPLHSSPISTLWYGIFLSRLVIRSL